MCIIMLMTHENKALAYENIMMHQDEAASDISVGDIIISTPKTAVARPMEYLKEEREES